MKLRMIPLLLVSMFLCLSSVDISKSYAKQEFSKEELKKMGEFLDVFTLLKLNNFTAKEILDPKKPEEMIYFGVWYYFIFDFDKVEFHKDGKLALSDKYVAEALKRYFDYTITEFPSVLPSDDTMDFIWKDGKYFFGGADGGGADVTRVEKAKKLANGNIQIEGILYNADSQDEEIYGTFVALVKPRIYKGKNTWTIISIKTTYTGEYAQ